MVEHDWDGCDGNEVLESGDDRQVRIHLYVPLMALHAFHGRLNRWRATAGWVMPAVARLSRMPRTPACPMASRALSGVWSSMTATPRASAPRACMPYSVAVLSVP